MLVLDQQRSKILAVFDKSVELAHSRWSPIAEKDQWNKKYILSLLIESFFREIYYT